MPRYIDAEQLYQKIKDIPYSNAYDFILAISREIQTARTADVAPVVLCKDCKYYQSVAPHCGNCGNTTIIMHPDDYCSRGRRKADA